MKHKKGWGAAAVVVLCLCFSGMTSHGGTLTIGAGSTVDIKGGLLNMDCQAITIRNGGSLLLQDGRLEKKDLVSVESGGVYSVTGGIVVDCSRKSFYFFYNDEGLPVIYVLPKGS